MRGLSAVKLPRARGAVIGNARDGSGFWIAGGHCRADLLRLSEARAGGCETHLSITAACDGEGQRRGEAIHHFTCFSHPHFLYLSCECRDNVLFGRQRYQNVRTAALADVKLDLFHSQRMIAENLNLARQSAQRLLEHWPRLAPQSDAHSAANNQTIFMADPGVRADGSLAAKARWAVQILNTTQASAEDTFFDLPGVGTALQH